jgi:hypothetical protein
MLSANLGAHQTARLMLSHRERQHFLPTNWRKVANSLADSRKRLSLTIGRLILERRRNSCTYFHDGAILHL